MDNKLKFFRERVYRIRAEYRKAGLPYYIRKVPIKRASMLVTAGYAKAVIPVAIATSGLRSGSSNP